MKYLAVAFLALFLSACATQETASSGTSAGTGKDCVKRTGSNLCS
ncbi:hypothetical protein [Ramlibacter albus]|nr:hypothetical protein [Ramlibacter albus]